MSYFDSIVAEASAAEAKASGLWGKAKAFAAGLWAKLPVKAPAKVEAGVERHRSVVTTGMVTLAALTALFCTYRLGGSDARAEFAAYVAQERVAAADEKTLEADARSEVERAATRRADAADARARDLQSRIDGYVADLSRRPVDARCTLSDSDVRRLRDDAAPARPRRRAARPAESAD